MDESKRETEPAAASIQEFANAIHASFLVRWQSHRAGLAREGIAAPAKPPARERQPRRLAL